MRVVVADTTPIRYLAEIDHIDLLPRLFGQIFIPSIVYGELQHPAAPAAVRDSLKAPLNWLKIVAAAETSGIRPAGCGRESCDPPRPGVKGRSAPHR